MTLASTSASTPNNSAAAASAVAPSQPVNDGITPLQFGMAAIILGASAGLTLYTKRTGQLLNQMERASKNATQRKGPQKFGPKTKIQWEKTRSRWEKDDMWFSKGGWAWRCLIGEARLEIDTIEDILWFRGSKNENIRHEGYSCQVLVLWN